MRITVIQMNPGADKQANIAQAARLIEQAAAADRPDLVILPEMWSCLGGSRQDKLDAAEALPPGQPGGAAARFLSDTARRLRITLHGGSIGEALPGADGRIANTTLLFGADGAELARYRKIHLFDITTPDGQGYRESATYQPGDRLVTATIAPPADSQPGPHPQAAGLTLGLAICYDLRFPELFAQLRARGAELICLPAAFTAETGRDHWEPLLRARAIETQCWFAAAATTGRHVEIGHDGSSPRFTHGHSLICDPWGHVLARASDGPGWASARLDPALTARVRAAIPLDRHRRVAGLPGALA